jgi:tetratricopeptide (TPR) repeat protein
MYDKAIEDFERALNYFKKDEVYNKNKIFETSILLGICYLNKNNIRESSKLFNEVFEQRDINDDTENVRGYVCKGVNYYSRGDINKACEYFKKANNLNGNLQEMVGGIICEIVQKCKCDGIRFVDQAEEFECTRKMLRDKGIL